MHARTPPAAVLAAKFGVRPGGWSIAAARSARAGSASAACRASTTASAWSSAAWKSRWSSRISSWPARTRWLSVTSISRDEAGDMRRDRGDVAADIGVVGAFDEPAARPPVLRVPGGGNRRHQERRRQPQPPQERPQIVPGWNGDRRATDCDAVHGLILRRARSRELGAYAPNLGVYTHNVNAWKIAALGRVWLGLVPDRRRRGAQNGSLKGRRSIS